MNDKTERRLLIGWNEWCSLPSLNIPVIKAKIDTGAKTSSLHAISIEAFRKKGQYWARFLIHPLQRDRNCVMKCISPIIDQRHVMSSNGHIENRYVIATRLVISDLEWDIELTLSNRDPLKFRMLLGREALDGRVLIDPAHTLLQGKISKKERYHLYGIKPPK